MVEPNLEVVDRLEHNRDASVLRRPGNAPQALDDPVIGNGRVRLVRAQSLHEPDDDQSIQPRRLVDIVVQPADRAASHQRVGA